ncbi:MAG: MFS transporter [Oscillospiraceae bacterium]
MKERNGQLRYLSIVIGAFLSVGVIVGLTNNLYSLYVIPITTGLGISRGLYSMGITVRYIASAFCNLFMGRLYQRFGYRRPTVLLVLLVAASYVGYGTARNAVPLFLGALIYGVGEYFISTAALSRMLGNWFQSHLGVVTGIVMAASGVGGSALSLVLSGIMESAGWRASLLFAAGLLAAVAVMIFFVMKDRPEELGLQPYHDPERRGAAHKPKKVASPWAGVPMQVLLKKPYFYLTMIGMMLATIASNGVYSAVVPHLQDRGLSAAYAAKMLSLMLVLLAVDKIVLGMLADRFGAHFSTLLCVLFTFSGIVVLTLVKNEWQAVIAVAAVGVRQRLHPAAAGRGDLRPQRLQYDARHHDGHAVGRRAAVFAAGELQLRRHELLYPHPDRPGRHRGSRRAVPPARVPRGGKIPPRAGGLRSAE